MKKNEYIDVPEGIEVIWGLVKSKLPSKNVKKICIAAIYINPRSKIKQQNIDHIIQSIHVVRSKYGNDIFFALTGDFNKTKIEDILNCYGALQQVVSETKRKKDILDLILPDMHTKYLPPVNPFRGQPQPER